MANIRPLVASLDIGTSRVRAIVGERNEKSQIEIIGVGDVPSMGMKNGIVVNIEACVRSIGQAIEAAEMMSGREVKTVWAGIGGSHIEGINSRGVVAITGRNGESRGEINETDMARVIEAAQAVVIPMDKQRLEVIPQTYIVDNQRDIREPIDMLGTRLEAEVHIITCSITSAQNLIKCVNRAGFPVNDLVLQILAAGRAVLTSEEKETGVALIDMGGGTTEMMVYTQGAPYSTYTVPLGGFDVTNDITYGLKIAFDTAEDLKKKAGCCWDELIEDGASVDVPGMGGRPPMSVSVAHLYQIILPRMEEILGMARDKLVKLSQSITRPLGGGIVLTGGGAQMPGIVELASEVFGMPVRVGSPLAIGGLESEYRRPEFAAAVGLVIEGNEREIGTASKQSPEGKKIEDGRPGFWSRLGNWIKGEMF
ncbi:MAG: cell division protein FtsA [Spirochaetaceae bacterium]|nr:cell division protein FtsA [Spirochaetaceae bacterium]